ncbi:thioredoxin fold domain-containing protein [Taibaiella lutea]|uniref:Thioredoxin fold domain-containing protein n=1 Tax=Taibaiella lutea TaxID=2608001 RepID=A0A5M6CH49_9BACT|nr:thioredoxin family protein [Taibaiella lutea]KAA5533252.1 thioredoxin fold domain-containing protein [Taibaiella lutea]
MKRFLFLLSFVLLLLPTTFGQQVKDAIQWQYNARKTSDSTFDITIAAKIKEGWHIYTATPKGDGSQIPTTIAFDKNVNIKLLGKTTNNGKPVNEEIKDLGITIQYYKNAVTYTQKVLAKANTVLSGVVDFQICNDEMCLPSKPERFKIPLNGIVGSNVAISPADTGASNETMNDSSGAGAANMGNGTGNDTSGNNTAVVNSATGAQQKLASEDPGLEKSSLWELFLAGLVAGFIAFIMPCIYAMLPITVSFFTKRSKTRTAGIKNATIYSFSIIAIFTLIGALVSLLFTEKTMYELSTSMGFNLFVFVLFIVFGISLLGAFEITLPASWSSKLDSKANSNSFGGIFFMALVLVVVSFSCTSAFISSLIVYIVKSGNSLGGLVGFFGFGLSIALPFALGAFFPGMLNGIAKSGGWLNAVKVTMGFLELAMAMKFLSNIDLQYHWHLLDFEVYLSIWIVIFALLGFYLLGKLSFSHDDGLPKNMFGQPYLSVPRLLFALIPLAFTVYLIPGLWGAPLSGVSGFLPERKTLDFNIQDNLINIQANMGNSSKDNPNTVMPQKYTQNLKSELPGVVAFFDYDEALAAAKKTGKPVLLDFTGHSCVNCRKMERVVLSKPEILRELSQNFIVASLYCDEKETQLLENEKYTAKDGSKIENLGEKNLDIELTKFGAVAQPLYIFVDGDGNVIKNAGGFVPDVQRFLNIINEVKAAHKKP